VVDAFGGLLPIQARVCRMSSLKQEMDPSKVRLLLTGGSGKKNDIYDGESARAILQAFGVTEKLEPTPPVDHRVRVPNQPRTLIGESNPSGAMTAAPQLSKYRPPFFDDMLQTSEWWGFEDYTHALLRMLGIHNLHPIPRDNQAGRPDGVFTIGSLAAIYDATLNSESDTFKQQQIRNYINELKRGELNIPPSHTEPIAHCTKKRVWLLVRGRSGVAKTEGSIKVCYVDVQHLMSLCEKRLVNTISLEDLEDELARMGT